MKQTLFVLGSIYKCDQQRTKWDRNEPDPQSGSAIAGGGCVEEGSVAESRSVFCRGGSGERRGGRRTKESEEEEGHSGSHPEESEEDEDTEQKRTSRRRRMAKRAGFSTHGDICDVQLCLIAILLQDYRHTHSTKRLQTTVPSTIQRYREIRNTKAIEQGSEPAGRRASGRKRERRTVLKTW